MIYQAKYAKIFIAHFRRDGKLQRIIPTELFSSGDGFNGLEIITRRPGDKSLFVTATPKLVLLSLISGKTIRRTDKKVSCFTLSPVTGILSAIQDDASVIQYRIDETNNKFRKIRIISILPASELVGRSIVSMCDGRGILLLCSYSKLQHGSMSSFQYQMYNENGEAIRKMDLDYHLYFASQTGKSPLKKKEKKEKKMMILLRYLSLLSIIMKDISVSMLMQIIDCMFCLLSNRNCLSIRR